MRCLLMVVFCLAFAGVRAQTNLGILFKKGAELEYRTYTPKYKMFKPELVEVTRLTLIVTDVKDSNNTTYSYITKKANSIKYPEIGYEKKYVVTRTGDEVTLPQDLYLIDTVFRADMLPGKNKKKADEPYATARFLGKGSSTFSFDFEKGKMEYSPKTVKMEFTQITAGAPGTPNEGFISTNTYEMEATAKNIKIEEKTKLKTEAGSFDCYKVSAVTEVKSDLLRKPTERMGVSYYSPQYGLIKGGGLHDEEGYTVLSRVKE